MIHAFLVDSKPDKHINSCHDAVERILFTTAKHCLKTKNVKKHLTVFWVERILKEDLGMVPGEPSPLSPFCPWIFLSFVNICQIVLQALLFKYSIFNKHC